MKAIDILRVPAARIAHLFASNGTVPAPAELKGETAQADPSRLWDKMGQSGYNPSELVTRRGLDVFDRMRRDDQVRAALALRKLAAISTGWKIQSPEDRDEVDELGKVTTRWEVTEFVEWMLRQYLVGTLEAALEAILTSLDYGYSISEKVYGEIESGPWSGKLGLLELKTRHPKSFEFGADTEGNLQRLIQIQTGGRVDLDPAKFVISVNGFEFGNWYGKSELEHAYRSWFIKDNAYKWLGMGLERYGLSPILFRYDPNLVPADMKNDIKTIFTNLQADTRGLLPGAPGAFEAFEFSQGERVARIFTQVLQMFNQDIARALLLPGLLGVSADAQQGSFARSKVNFEVFMLIVERDRTRLAVDVMDHQVIRQVVDLNFGPQEEYPYFEFLPMTEQNKAAILTAWKDLVGARVVHNSPADEAHVREILEFPEMQEEPEEEEPTPPQSEGPPGPEDTDDSGVAPAAWPSEPDDEGAPPEGKPQPDAGEPRIETATATDRGRAFALSRARTRYERVVKFTQIEKNLDGIQGDGVDAAKGVLSESRDRLIAKVERAGTVNLAFIRDLSLYGQGQLRAAFRQMLNDGFDAGAEDLRDEAGAIEGKRFVIGGPMFLPKDALRFLNSKSLELAATTNERLLAEIKRVLQQQLTAGLGVRETVQKLSDVFESYLGDDGVIRDGEALAPWRLEAIARTESTAAYNQGRLVMARDQDIAEFMTGMQYSAIIDTRTTEVCRHLDQKIFRMGDEEMDRLTPPNHVNCRSLLVPVTVSTQVDEGDFITAGETGKGIDLAGKGFA